MHPSIRHRTAAAVALALLLAGCGGASDPKGAKGLASLDARLTNGMLAENNAVEAANRTAATDASAPTKAAKASAPRISAPRAASRLAATQGRAVGGCAGRDLRYGEHWASRMPDGLGLTPGATLVEAAGSDTDRCALRVVSFTTTDSPEKVAAVYSQRARTAGFDAERLPCRDEIRLGGTRADAAYLFFARRKDGVTEVDVIASAGKA